MRTRTILAAAFSATLAISGGLAAQPAAADSTPQLYISEIESQGGLGGDWIELQNANFDVEASFLPAGWVLTDAQNEHPYTIPAGTEVVIPTVFRQGEHFQFGLGEADTVYLKDPSGKVVDSFSWTRHADGAFCRNYYGGSRWLDQPATPMTATGCGENPAKTGTAKPAATDVQGPLVEIADFYGLAMRDPQRIKVGENFSYQVKATGDSTLRYSATALPAGVTINASTGLVSGKPTVTGQFTPTLVVTDAHGNTALGERLQLDVWVDVYTTPGTHTVNGRQWRTACEPYSQTTRCRTEIWASAYVDPATNGGYYVKSGWTFNNLTYLPSDRSLWNDNPLGAYAKYAGTAKWTASDGRQWRTECDSPATGRKGCRSYAWVTVHGALGLENMWVFNNIVKFN